MTKQENAQKRNWARFRLLGIRANLLSAKNTHLTEFEKNELNLAIMSIDTVFKHWKDSTEELNQLLEK